MREGAEGTAVAEEGPPPSFAAFRLPPGKHGIPPEQVVENQRWRLLGAAAEVLAERGYDRIRAGDVCTRAAVSRETFYEHFDDLDDCLQSAFEMTADCLVDLVSAFCEGERKTCEGETKAGRSVRPALDQVLGFLAKEPALAHLLGPEVAAATPAIAAARERLVRKLTSRRVARHRVEGALAFVSEQSLPGDSDRLPGLAAQLAELIASSESRG